MAAHWLRHLAASFGKSTATGTPAPTVQWQVSSMNGVPGTFSNVQGATSGSTSPTLSFRSAQLAQNGLVYQAVPRRGLRRRAATRNEERRMRN